MIIALVRDCVIIVGSALLGLHPFDRRRTFAPWAKKAFGLIAVVGVVFGFLHFAWDIGWFTLGSAARSLLDRLFALGGGLVLGLILSLVLSGQFFGSRKAEPK